MRFRNYINRHNKKNRIYSLEELLAMTLNDLLDNEPAILSQDRDIGIPSYEELRQSPNTRWIDSYTNKYGQKLGGFYGSINDNYYANTSFAPDISKTKPLDEKLDKFRPIFMDDAPVEENEEEPIVLEGGVEENVYLPDVADDEKDTDPNVYIPDEEESEQQKNTPYELSDEDLADILQSIIKSKTTASTEQKPFLEDSFPTIPQMDTTSNTSSALSQIQSSLNQEELKQMWEKLMEELRKMLGKYKWSNNSSNVLQQNPINNHKLSLKEFASEIKNYSKRKNQKAEIDDYLNDYVERKNVPNEYKNALRHRAGSLLMAKKSGDNDKSQLWGNIKEFLDLVSGHDSKIGSAIDAQNNYIGRNIYEKYKNDNLSEDELMDKIIESIKKYNPNETDFIEWQNKNSKIPLKSIFDAINNSTRPINKIYHRIEKSIDKNTKIKV